MEVPSTPPIISLVASSQKSLETTLVDEELVPTTNDDQWGEEDDYGREYDWGHGHQGLGERGHTCQPHKANSGICISSTSTMEEEGSFVRYTLRMLLCMTCILDIVSILHAIILDK